MTGFRHQLRARTARARPEWNGRRPLILLDALSIWQDVGDVVLALGSVLMDELDPRTRGLVALRVSALRPSDYVWTGTAATMVEHDTLNRHEIMRVAYGPTAFVGREAAVLWTVAHVLANRPIDPATRASLGERDLLAVTVTTHFYALLTSITRGLGPEPGVPLITGIETAANALGTYIEGSA